MLPVDALPLSSTVDALLDRLVAAGVGRERERPEARALDGTGIDRRCRRCSDVTLTVAVGAVVVMSAPPAPSASAPSA